MKEYEKMIFMSEEKQKQWDNLPRTQKDYFEKNLLQKCKSMEHNLAIEMLANVINELGIRIAKLETQRIYANL